MTAAGSAVETTSSTWRAVLPAGRDFVLLPSRERPLLAADLDPAVLGYVRRTLLARPPGSRLPGWAYGLARQALRARPAWQLAPRWRATVDEAATWQAELSAWLTASGHRVVALDHSHDPDHRVVLLLFRPNHRDPSLAVKLATCDAAVARLARERDRLAGLADAPLARVHATVARPVPLPVGAGGQVLATTALRGTPMFVSYYRNGRHRDPDAVRADFAAAGAWLAALQSATTGPPTPLDVDEATLAAARTEPAGPPDQRDTIARGLAALRQRLRRHSAPASVVHGDYWAGNILLDGGTVSGVVDWEGWQLAGSPIRDVGRFAVSYSLYLDRQTRAGRSVRGHPGLIAGAAGGGVGYALHGAGWYPQVVRSFLDDALTRLDLPTWLGPDVVLAELAALAAEATQPSFADQLWRCFALLCRTYP